MGDSYVWGSGLNDDETFSALLQEELRARQQPIEVINAGIGSYSPLLHYLTLRDLHLKLQPDAVMVWFTFNDLQDDYLYSQHIRYDAAGRPLACDPNWKNGRFDWAGYIRRHSALAQYFYNKFVRGYRRIQALGLGEYLRLKLQGKRSKIALAALPPERRHHIDALLYDTMLMLRGQGVEPIIQQHWKQTGGYLLFIRELLRERGIPMVLGVLPMGVQVGPDQWSEGRKYLGFEPGKIYDDPFPFEFLERFAREYDIPFINPWQDFVAARHQKLFYTWDGHCTPAGNRVIYESLMRHPVFLTLLHELRMKAETRKEAGT
jgi:hypothetical protein